VPNPCDLCRMLQGPTKFSQVDTCFLLARPSYFAPVVRQALVGILLGAVVVAWALGYGEGHMHSWEVYHLSQRGLLVRPPWWCGSTSVHCVPVAFLSTLPIRHLCCLGTDLFNEVLVLKFHLFQPHWGSWSSTLLP
jgi:hypothetical protein